MTDDSSVVLPPTRKQVREAFKRGTTPSATNSWTEQKPARMAYDAGVIKMKVDPALYEALLDVASLSLGLLEYTEKGGAGTMRPREFEALVKRLRGLQSLLQVETGTGELVSDLLALLDSLED